jgi:hypothetical protein
MKRILFLLSALLLFTCCLYAQNNRSSIRLRLSDGTLLRVAVNGRYFEKTGTSLTIGDVPGRRPHIKVYRFRPYAYGKGGKAELVYSGTIKIKRGTAYDAVVDVRKQELMLKEISPLQNIPGKPPFDPKRDQVIGENNVEIPETANDSGISTLSPQLKTVKAAMDQQVSDMEKLQTVKKYVGDSISAGDVKQIASWFFFDDTKLKFLEMVYPKISDKEHAETLKAVFMEGNSKTQFEQFLKKQ